MTCMQYEKTKYMHINTPFALSELEIVLERVLVLFRAGTASLQSSLGTFFFNSGARPCEAFSLDI